MIADPGRVSVVIPTYNRAALLPAAVASVRAQTAADRCEIVIVDDGSTDDTSDVVAQLGADIRYVRQANAGPGAARNAGLRASRGEFIAFLDSDDAWAPDKIERQLAAMDGHPEVALVAGQSIARTPEGVEVPHVISPPLPAGRPVDLAERLVLKCVIETPTIMVRRQCLDDVGLFNTNLRRAQDYHLWLRLALRYPLYYLPAPAVATFAVAAPHSLSVDVAGQSQALIHALDLIRPLLRRRPDCVAAWHAHMAGLYGVLRNHARKRRDMFNTARYTLMSLRHAPRGRSWEWRLIVESVFKGLFRVQGRRTGVASGLRGRRLRTAPGRTEVRGSSSLDNRSADLAGVTR